MKLPSFVDTRTGEETPYHDFGQSLAKGQAVGDEPLWEAIYREAFPDFHAAIDLRNDMHYQKLGIDRKVVLKSGRTLYTDEKLRDRYWKDILLEYQHTPHNGGEAWDGWANKQQAMDFLAYAFKWRIGALCYLFPWQSLRKAWLDNQETWLGLYKPVKATNRTYTTSSLPIPTTVLLEAVSNAQFVQVGNAKEPQLQQTAETVEQPKAKQLNLFPDFSPLH